jgi:hypothetical protein
LACARVKPCPPINSAICSSYLLPVTTFITRCQCDVGWPYFFSMGGKCQSRPESRSFTTRVPQGFMSVRSRRV